jgi:hypothetical protein
MTDKNKDKENRLFPIKKISLTQPRKEYLSRGTFLLLVSILSLFSFKVTTGRSIPLALCYDDLGPLGLFLNVSKLYN